MPRKRKNPVLFDPKGALRVDVQEYTRPSDGRLLKIKFYVFPCANGCGAEIRLRSGNLGNAGRCKQCFYSTLPNRFRLRPFEAMYNTLRANGKKRHRVDTLTYEEFLTFTGTSTCHYCDAEIGWSPFNSHRSRKAYNLDRKDNRVGYAKENCVVCCWRCNLVKGNVLTYEQMMRLSPVLCEFTRENNGVAIHDPKNRWGVV